MNIFYVYEHWRPDTNTCFYVGKGKGNRAWVLSPTHRGKAHRAVASLLISLSMSVQVKIIAENLAEDTAFLLERDRIKFHGRPSLANQSDGGEGPSGRVATTEDRARIGAAHKGRKQSPEWIAARVAGRKAKGSYTPSAETRAKMSAVRKGTVIPFEVRRKISAAGRGRKHPPETIKRMKAAAKLRGVSEATRAAAKKALTGRHRVPHRPESKELMRIAALEREARRRAAKAA